MKSFSSPLCFALHVMLKILAHDKTSTNFLKMILAIFKILDFNYHGYFKGSKQKEFNVDPCNSNSSLL